MRWQREAPGNHKNILWRCRRIPFWILHHRYEGLRCGLPPTHCPLYMYSVVPSVIIPQWSVSIFVHCVLVQEILGFCRRVYNARKLFCSDTLLPHTITLGIMPHAGICIYYVIWFVWVYLETITLMRNCAILHQVDQVEWTTPRN